MLYVRFIEIYCPNLDIVWIAKTFSFEVLTLKL